MEITDILSELGVEYRQAGEHHHARSGWLQIECPQCGGMDKFHCGISLFDGHANCWQCGPMKLGWLLSQASGQPWSLVKELLAGWGSAQSPAPQVAPSGKYKPPYGVEDLKPAHRRYLANRGLDPDEMVKLWGLGGLDIAGIWSWRIFIPLRYRGEAVSWTTRSLGTGGLRYRSADKTSEKYNHKHLLMGLDYTRGSCIVVEGPFDVMKIGPGAVATLGINWTPQQLALIAKVPRRAICFDSTPDAHRRAIELGRMLSTLPGETHVVQLDAKDAGEASDGEIEELRAAFL